MIVEQIDARTGNVALFEQPDEPVIECDMEVILKPTPEERLDALETTTDDMILLMAEMIGGE